MLEFLLYQGCRNYINIWKISIRQRLFMLQHTSLTAVEFFNDMLHEHTVTVRVHLYLKYYPFATYGFVNKFYWHFLILTIVFSSFTDGKNCTMFSNIKNTKNKPVSTQRNPYCAIPYHTTSPASAAVQHDMKLMALCFLAKVLPQPPSEENILMCSYT